MIIRQQYYAWTSAHLKSYFILYTCVRTVPGFDISNKKKKKQSVAKEETEKDRVSSINFVFIHLCGSIFNSYGEQ